MANCECHNQMVLIGWTSSRYGNIPRYVPIVFELWTNDSLDYPLVNIQKAIENGPVEIVDLPMKNSDFPISYVKLLIGLTY